MDKDQYAASAVVKECERLPLAADFASLKQGLAVEDEVGES